MRKKKERKNYMENVIHFFKRLKRHFESPRKFVLMLTSGRLPWLRIPISDKLYLKILYKEKCGAKLNLDPPHKLNEKLQWLKLYNRDPEYWRFADKYKVRDYIASEIGEEYLIPLIGKWDDPGDIDFNALPEKFVLKCNHNSSDGMCICTDKTVFDTDNAVKRIKRALKIDYFYMSREWPYKNIKKCVIAEAYLENSDGSPIADYKFYCFDGKPRYFMYSLGEADHNVRNHKFDMDMHSIDHLFKEKPAIEAQDIILPGNMNQMIQIVEKLCSGFPHIRIDLYSVAGKIYFGEMTFFSSGGFMKIYSEEFAQKMADLINIEKIKKRYE